MELEEGTTATTKGCGGDAVGSASDGGDDGQLVGCSDGSSFFFRQITEIFVIEINVDERAKLAVVAEKLLSELGILRGELVEDLGDGTAGDGDRLSSSGVGPERSWDVDVHG
jgi:hypothetical protein